MFSALSQTEIIILAKIFFSSAHAFNLVQSKNLSFGKDLPNDKISVLANLKVLLDEKINVDQMTE